jgi:hypothetical protein
LAGHSVEILSLQAKDGTKKINLPGMNETEIVSIHIISFQDSINS